MKNKKYFALFIMLALTCIVTGQNNMPPPAGPPNPPGLPVDGGLIFLIVSGVLYGIRKNIKN